MNRVIGGEFVIDPELLKQNHPLDNIKYSSGRAALYCILKNISKFGGILLIPNYLCDSITNTIIDAGWKYAFYTINDELVLSDIDGIELQEVDAILVINYFGLIDLEETIKRIREKNKSIIVIEDDVQAFYNYKSSIADYSFSSLRKWFPCPEGAFVRSSEDIKTIFKNTSEFGQYKIAGNLLKTWGNVINDSICLELLERGEALLDNEYLTECSEASKVIFSNIDLNQVAEIRRKNARVLHEGLVDMGIDHMYKEYAVPLFVPIFIDDRNILRRAFFENNIFTPVHWPVSNEALNGRNDIYKKELSLICDQRYNEEDMKKQLSIISQFLNRVQGTACETRP